MLAITPKRPAPNASCGQIKGPCDRTVMKNVIDDRTGIVQPTIFLRGEPFTTRAGLRTQSLVLAADPALSESRLFGGEFGVFVKSPAEASRFPKAIAPIRAAEIIGRTARSSGPTQDSRGTIRALSSKSDFPARVVVPVYYGFMLGGRDGKLSTKGDNFSVRAAEPHVMTAVVNRPARPRGPESPRGKRLDQGGVLPIFGQGGL